MTSVGKLWAAERSSAAVANSLHRCGGSDALRSSGHRSGPVPKLHRSFQDLSFEWRRSDLLSNVRLLLPREIRQNQIPVADLLLVDELMRLMQALDGSPSALARSCAPVPIVLREPTEQSPVAMPRGADHGMRASRPTQMIRS